MPNRSMTHEHAAFDLSIVVSDFRSAIQHVQTSEEALQIHQLIAEGRVELDAMESLALNRANALNGGK